MQPLLSLVLLALFAAVAAAAEPAASYPSYPPLPKSVSSFGAAVADGYVYAYGGHSGKAHTYSTATVSGKLHRLKLDGGKEWEELPGSEPAQGLALVSHGGKLYRIGGMQPRNAPGERADNVSLASCARFDPATRKWEALPDLPEGRSSHDAVVVKDRIVVLGGWKMNGTGKTDDWLTTGAVLDLSKSPLKWESIEQPFSRRALIAATLGGKVFVIGGMDSKGETLRTVEIYDPEKHAWSKGVDIPGPEFNGFSPAACVLDSQLYVSTSDGKIFRLTTKQDKWEEAGKLKQPRMVHRMVPYREALIVLGGASHSGTVDQTEVIVPKGCCGE